MLGLNWMEPYRDENNFFRVNIILSAYNTIWSAIIIHWSDITAVYGDSQLPLF